MQLETKFQLGCKYAGLYLQYQMSKPNFDEKAIEKLDSLFNTLFELLIK